MGKDDGPSASSPPPSAAGGKKARRKGPKKGPKPKMTKEERREKYTAIARERREANLARRREKDLVCYRCRKTGHSSENCRLADGNKVEGEGERAPPRKKKQGANICYKCGSTEHTIQLCPKIKKFLQRGKKIDFGKLGDLPYAECYVCGGSGHLASHCPASDRGVYPKGGSCRECGSVDHFAADCPEKEGGKGKDGDDASVESAKSVTIEQFLEEPTAVEEKPKTSAKKKRKVINF